MTTGPLSQIDIDALLLELGPRIDTEQHRAELGTVVYQAYVPFFGLQLQQAMQSEGMKYYGRTLIDEIVKMLRVANNAGELKKLADYSGDYHTPRDLTRDEFMGGMPIFVKAFDGILISELNRGRMKKFLENVFPAITATYFDQ